MHTFKNFKNFAEAEIDLSKPMTLLIGRNGSGKSNVIEGVELLAELIKGCEVSEITDVMRGGRFEIRGSLKGSFKQGCETFEIGFKDNCSRHRIEKADDEWTDEWDEYIEVQKNYKFSLNPYINIERQVNEKPIKEKSIHSNIEDIDRNYSEVSSFDIYSKAMRQYSPIGLKQLSKNGENISSILYYLKQYSPDILEKILNRIKQLPEESFVSFEFIDTSDNSDILFALKYPNGEIISAKLLSDGTLRALAILTALETVPEGSRIIIEEIDNGVHASRVNVLIDAIWEASNRRHLNTLITTHNPATLDSLTDEQLECVVVCHYDKQSQSAKLTPFFELPNIDVLLQKGKLGGLVTRNVIEHYLDPEFEKEQAKIAKEWLESCQ
jgi:predicted ATPase